MVDAWLTTISTDLGAVINPLTEVYEQGYLSNELSALENFDCRRSCKCCRRSILTELNKSTKGFCSKF